MRTFLYGVAGLVSGFGLVALLGPVEGPFMWLLIIVGFLIVAVEKQHRRIKELEGDDWN